MNRKLFVLFVVFFCCAYSHADDGHELWLAEFMDKNPEQLISYWEDRGFSFVEDQTMHAGGYSIRGKSVFAKDSIAMLYASYELAREEKTCGVHDVEFSPAFKYRILDHWDNLDGTIERGYAGQSIFWNTNRKTLLWKKRIEEYARANASIGINGSVLNNVNADPRVLTKEYLDTVKVIADIVRPYGIQVYLSVNFGSPKALGDLDTADPLDENVKKWWQFKVKQIYNMVPDFGGFLVKANSEGQPGPFDYGRSHADGANMLAEALRPYGGIVMWRSFVYGARHKGEDRVMQAVSEFKDQDGLFRDNVILQSKNGPLDFQPREPYAPIFDNIKQTAQMAEFQITQEYTGQSKHLVYLSPMWTEFFSFVSPERLQGIAGVGNIGNVTNWCGHPFSQANWYAFGRLAWNPSMKSKDIADEWLCQTFPESHIREFRESALEIMESSREACVDYMMPLGLHHIFKFDHHYGPEPDGYKSEYPLEWCPVYYHQADSLGVGFNRSSSGTNAANQYAEPYRSLYNNVSTCPDEYILWFHHVGWNDKLRNGKTLWWNLCKHYNQGVLSVKENLLVWSLLRPAFEQYHDIDRWQEVKRLMSVQLRNAIEWRNTCLTYFHSFNNMDIYE